MGFCEQCQRPWNDGLCECEFGLKYQKVIEDMVAEYCKMEKELEALKVYVEN
jgi:hypothetical protein